MNVKITSSVSHITTAGITVIIDVTVESETKTLTITSRSNGAREWRYMLLADGNQYRLDTDGFLKQEHKIGFDHNDVFDVSYVAHMVKYLGTDLSEKASEARWNSSMQSAA